MLDVICIIVAPTSLLQDEHYKIFLKNASTGIHSGHTGYVLDSLGHHLKEIAEILFFLMGAMTIVELLDATTEYSC